MTKFKSFLKSLGFFTSSEKSNSHNNLDNYNVLNGDKLEIHKLYLKNIENEENNRLNIIENKTSQLISQTGLIFSLLSLFIPFIIDKVLDFNFYLKILFIIILTLAYLSYILTINNALKNFNVKNFKYVKNSPDSVLKHQELKKKKFLIMEIKDLFSIIRNNIEINNRKASNLISAYNAFRLGNIFTSVLVVFLCTSLLFIQSKPHEILVKDSIEIEQFQDYIEILNELNTILKENLNNKVEDSLSIGK